jgi:hypothetical protein
MGGVSLKKLKRRPLLGRHENCGWIVECVQQGCNRGGLPRELQVRANLRERLEYKTAEMKPRVWNDETGSGTAHVPQVEDIQVHDPWGVDRAGLRTAHLGLNGLKRLKQFKRSAIEADLDHGVQEGAGVFSGVHRLRFVEAGGEHWTRDAGDVENGCSRELECGEPVAEV